VRGGWFAALPFARQVLLVDAPLGAVAGAMRLSMTTFALVLLSALVFLLVFVLIFVPIAIARFHISSNGPVCSHTNVKSPYGPFGERYVYLLELLLMKCKRFPLPKHIRGKSGLLSINTSPYNEKRLPLSR
jgi:hypothetical protein